MTPPFNAKQVARAAILSGALVPAAPEPTLIGSFKSTPGPAQGCKYLSPYRRRDRRTGG